MDDIGDVPNVQQSDFISLSEKELKGDKKEARASYEKEKEKEQLRHKKSINKSVVFFVKILCGVLLVFFAIYLAFVVWNAMGLRPTMDTSIMENRIGEALLIIGGALLGALLGQKK